MKNFEGFFDICNARGLTGKQGVIIPYANIDRLMLKKELVEAAKKEQFQIFAVKTLDEAIAIATGLDAGVRKQDGKFPLQFNQRQSRGGINALLKENQEPQIQWVIPNL